MSVCAFNLALCGLQVKWFGVIMCLKNHVKKTKVRKPKRVSRHRRRISTTALRILYPCLILFATFILAEIALFLRVETPGVWEFLSSISSSLVLIYIVGRNVR